MKSHLTLLATTADMITADMITKGANRNWICFSWPLSLVETRPIFMRSFVG